jgi:hypothetical protein
VSTPGNCTGGSTHHGTSPGWYCVGGRRYGTGSSTGTLLLLPLLLLLLLG